MGRKSCAVGFRERAEENCVEVVQEVVDSDGVEETNIVMVEAGNSVVGWVEAGCCTLRCREESSSTAAWSGSTARSTGGSTLTTEVITVVAGGDTIVVAKEGTAVVTVGDIAEVTSVVTTVVIVVGVVVRTLGVTAGTTELVHGVRGRWSL